MSISIKNEFGLDSGSLCCLNLFQNGCLNLVNWNLTFIRVVIISHGLFDSIGQISHTDDFIAEDVLHLTTQECFSGSGSSHDETVRSFVAEFFIKQLFAPVIHGFKFEFLLEHRINAVVLEVIVLNFNCGSSISWINYRGNAGTILFEFIYLLDVIWEVGQNELVNTLLTTIDNLLQHLDDLLIRNRFLGIEK